MHAALEARAIPTVFNRGTTGAYTLRMSFTQPLWDRSPLPRFSSLDTDVQTDVAVIGGGITGLTVALLLAQAGKRVRLLEARRLAAGVSGRTTAHLTEALDTRYHALESKFGRDGAALARASSREAIEKIAALASSSTVDCGFERLDGYLFAGDEKQAGELDDELAAAQRAGAAVRKVSQIPLPLDAHGAVVFANQAQFRPVDYLRGVTERLIEAGGRIHEGGLISQIENEGQFRLTTCAGRLVTADAVVVATHAPFQTMKLELQLAQYRSYAVSGPLARPLGGLFWDMADPYRYYRSATIDGQEQLIVGGGDHRTGTLPDAGPEAPFHELERLAARLGSAASKRWSAQVAESSDGLPFIGKPDAKQELYLAQGFAGNGLTFGTLAAMMISDALLGLDNRYAELYRADRFKPIASARRQCCRRTPRLRPTSWPGTSNRSRSVR